jgi:alpha-glucosidase
MLPGTSVTYYGEEIGMADSCAKFGSNHNNSATKCDPNTTDYSDAWCRSPMQWDDTDHGGFTKDRVAWIPIGDNYKTVNVKAQSGKEKSHLEIHRQLLKLRKNKAIMESDKFEIKVLGEYSFGFKR